MSLHILTASPLTGDMPSFSLRKVIKISVNYLIMMMLFCVALKFFNPLIIFSGYFAILTRQLPAARSQTAIIAVTMRAVGQLFAQADGSVPIYYKIGANGVGNDGRWLLIVIRL